MPPPRGDRSLLGKGCEGVVSCYDGAMAEQFDEYLDTLRGWDGNENLPESVISGIEKGYQAVIDQRDGAAVTIDDLRKTNESLLGEVNRLKSENYDLALSKGAEKEVPDSKEPPKGVIGLFDRKERV